MEYFREIFQPGNTIGNINAPSAVTFKVALRTKAMHTVQAWSKCSVN